MNQWAFVAAAYGLAVLAIAGLVAWSWVSMRRAEQAAEAVRRGR
ncbi:MAG: heme exporter protein CcmD [Sphingomonas sp.]|nr:heme exporter protein CcmD [Sphingomonas sp.]